VGYAEVVTPQDNLPEEAPHIGPILEDRSRHERYAPQELAIVLSHYDIGVISRLRPYLRGSRLAPKLQIRSDRGLFLLKRRAPNRAQYDRVAFAHCIQRQLLEAHFPVPALIPTRNGETLTQHEGRVYEMFEFVRGRRYDRSIESTARAGVALGSFHRLMDGYRPPHQPPSGTFHAAADVEATFNRLPRAIAIADPEVDREPLKQTVRYLSEAYADASARVDEAGYDTWAPGVLHGDWHPGNLLFRDGAVVAVLDFDSSRVEPRMADVANGALQFSMDMTDPDDPTKWPSGLDITRIRTFLAGYDSAAVAPLTSGERAAVPWLIIEALVIESIVPIAATGKFAHIHGAAFLDMIQSKVQWLRPRARKLVEYLEKSEVR
jgi:homoserine kinase type II